MHTSSRTRLRWQRLSRVLLTVAAAGASGPLLANEPLPADVVAMIDAAAATGDAELETVANIARKTNPNAGASIDALVKHWRTAATEARLQKLAEQGYLQGITGQGEAGFNTSSGNTESTGIALGLAAAKETLRWKHAVKASVDYQRDYGVTSKERLFAGYEGTFKFRPRFYTVIVLNWERDRFAGFDSRFSQSLGVGYKVIDQPKLKLGLEFGPALRETNYAPGEFETNLSWRSAGAAEWAIAPSTKLTQNVSVYLEDEKHTSVAATSALTTKVIGALSARASFVLQYESDPPLDLRKTDTTTRFTLVYGF